MAETKEQLKSVLNLDPELEIDPSHTGLDLGAIHATRPGLSDEVEYTPVAQEEPDAEEAKAAEEEPDDGDQEEEISDEPTADEPEEKKAKPRRGVQKRLDELTKNWRDEQRRSDDLQRQLSEAIALAKQGRVEEVQETQENEAPVRDTFDDDTDYAVARAKWEIRQEDAQRAEQTKRETEANQAKTALADQAQAFIDKGAEQFPDFKEVALTEDVPLSQDIAVALFDLDRGHEVLYTLAQTPERLADLGKLSPVKIAIELGKVEAALPSDEEETAPVKKVSKAPAPVKRVKPAVDANVPLEKLSHEEYRKARGFERIAP